MGTIAHAYESGGQATQKGVFSNLVTLVKVDGKVDPAEIALLERIAQRLSLTPEQAKEIMDHPEEYPMIPPVEKQERFARMIQFIQMTFIDGEVDPSEERLVTKYGIGLGFEENDVASYFSTILGKVKAGEKADTILESLL